MKNLSGDMVSTARSRHVNYGGAKSVSKKQLIVDGYPDHGNPKN